MIVQSVVSAQPLLTSLPADGVDSPPPAAETEGEFDPDSVEGAGGTGLVAVPMPMRAVFPQGQLLARLGDARPISVDSAGTRGAGETVATGEGMPGADTLLGLPGVPTGGCAEDARVNVAVGQMAALAVAADGGKAGFATNLKEAKIAGPVPSVTRDEAEISADNQSDAEADGPSKSLQAHEATGPLKHQNTGHVAGPLGDAGGSTATGVETGLSVMSGTDVWPRTGLGEDEGLPIRQESVEGPLAAPSPAVNSSKMTAVGALIAEQAIRLSLIARGGLAATEGTKPDMTADESEGVAHARQTALPPTQPFQMGPPQAQVSATDKDPALRDAVADWIKGEEAKLLAETAANPHAADHARTTQPSLQASTVIGPVIGPPAGFWGIPKLVSHSLAAGMDQIVQVTAPSDDIGGLRIEIAANGDTVRMVLMAERPETVDLLRKHLDQLRSELSSSGFANADLSFGSWTGSRTPPGAKSGFVSAEIYLSDADDAVPLFPATIPEARTAMAGGLDLRL